MNNYQRFKYVIVFSLFLFFGFGQNLFAREPSLQKPKTYTHEEEITGWVMSEKLDGVRGYWDGRQLLTRKGGALNPPSWFLYETHPPQKGIVFRWFLAFCSNNTLIDSTN